jgi:hypothetical protein
MNDSSINDSRFKGCTPGCDNMDGGASVAFRMDHCKPDCDHQTNWARTDDGRQQPWFDWWIDHCKVNDPCDKHDDGHDLRFDNHDDCKVDDCDGHNNGQVVRFDDHDKCKFDPCDMGWDSNRMSWDDWSKKCKVDFCRDKDFDSHKMSWDDWSNRCKVDKCRDNDWHRDGMDWNDWKDRCKVDFCEAIGGQSHQIIIRQDDNRRFDEHRSKDFDDHKVKQICVKTEVVVVVRTIVQQIIVTQPPPPQVVVVNAPPAQQVVSAAQPQPVIKFAPAPARVVASASVIKVPSTGDAGLAAPQRQDGKPSLLTDLAALLAGSALVLGGYTLAKKTRRS